MNYKDIRRRLGIVQETPAIANFIGPVSAQIHSTLIALRGFMDTTSSACKAMLRDYAAM